MDVEEMRTRIWAIFGLMDNERRTQMINRSEVLLLEQWDEEKAAKAKRAPAPSATAHQPQGRHDGVLPFRRVTRRTVSQ